MRDSIVYLQEVIKNRLGCKRGGCYKWQKRWTYLVSALTNKPRPNNINRLTEEDCDSACTTARYCVVDLRSLEAQLVY